MARWKAEGAAFGAEREVGPKFFEDARKQDVLAAVGAVSAPVLILHGGRDEVVPVEEAYALQDRLREALTARGERVAVVNRSSGRAVIGLVVDASTVAVGF